MSIITTNHDTHAPIPAITDETFEAEVIQSQVPVLVAFSAEWCAPCRLMHSVLSELAVALRDQLRIVTVDVDQDPVHAGQLGVRGMPTLFLFHD